MPWMMDGYVPIQFDYYLQHKPDRTISDSCTNQKKKTLCPFPLKTLLYLNLLD